jgi:hypothetical protein
MGDIADWLLASEYDDWEDGDEGEEFGGRQPGSSWTPKAPRCKRCGSTAVRWRHQGGRWVLFTLQPGVVHNCQQRGPATADDFEAIGAAPPPARRAIRCVDCADTGRLPSGRTCPCAEDEPPW